MTAFEVVTLFPELLQAFASVGIVGRAGRDGTVEIHATNPRDFTPDRHRIVDGIPFGGGAGMVLKLEPVLAALASLEAARGPTRRILLTPTGRPFTQRDAERLGTYPRITLLCGRYEGIDDRIRADVDEAISIGDFVLNGGEVAAMAIIEAISRLSSGVLHNPDSARDDSFTAVEGRSLGPHLEHPHYTRPPVVAGRAVPSVLLAGDHGRVSLWRTRASLVRTWAVRPELRPAWCLDEDTPVVLWVARGGEALLDVTRLAASGVSELSFEGARPPELAGSAPEEGPGAVVANATANRGQPPGASLLVRAGESLAELRRRRRRHGRGEPLIVVLREAASIAEPLVRPLVDQDGGVEIGDSVDQPVVDRVAALLDLLAHERPEVIRVPPDPAGSAACGRLAASAGLILVLAPDQGGRSALIASNGFVELLLRAPRAAIDTQEGVGRLESAQIARDLESPEPAPTERDLGSLAFVARMIDASRPRWTGGASPLAVSTAIASLVRALRRAGREPSPPEFTP